MNFEEIIEYKLIPIEDEENIFYKVSDSNLKKIIELYYSSKKNVKAIVADYKLPLTNMSMFSKSLPYYYMDKQCPYDDTYLTVQLPSKSGLQTYSPDGICLVCEHKEYSTNNFANKRCDCLNCEKKQVIEKKKVIKVLSEVYSDPIELKELSIMDRIHIAALLQIVDIDYNDLIPPFRMYSEVNNNFSDSVLSELLDKNLLEISDQNSIDIFSNITESSFSYNRQESYLSLNIYDEHYDKEELFELLRTGTGIEIKDVEELVSIWREFAKKELYKLFKFQMKELKFTRELDHTEKEKKILNAFDRWLEFYSPSQIYAILYKVIRDADNIRTSGKMGNYSYNEIAFIEKLADQMIIKYEKEEWEIKSYNYPFKLEVDLQTAIFFSKVAKEKNWFNEIAPTSEKVIKEEIDDNMTIVKNYSEYINEIEIQKGDAFLTSTLEDAVYYYLSPIGLIIHDSNIECLFATRKSLVDYATFLETNGKIDNNIKAATIEEKISYNSGFYVNGSYSSQLIYHAISKLIEGQVQLMEESEKY
ncbi:MAG: hypothetical protein ABS911_09915 [Carnobacterium sp.]|uniref:hypothetical protein n=1 Tax=Carnobacterium sp. TaxID=48221 RepID=UPI003314551F